jgi:hypothetical protein
LTIHFATISDNRGRFVVVDVVVVVVVVVGVDVVAMGLRGEVEQLSSTRRLE